MCFSSFEVKMLVLSFVGLNEPCVFEADVVYDDHIRIQFKYTLYVLHIWARNLYDKAEVQRFTHGHWKPHIRSQHKELREQLCQRKTFFFDSSMKNACSDSPESWWQVRRSVGLQAVKEEDSQWIFCCIFEIKIYSSRRKCPKATFTHETRWYRLYCTTPAR